MNFKDVSSKVCKKIYIYLKIWGKPDIIEILDVYNATQTYTAGIFLSIY